MTSIDHSQATDEQFPEASRRPAQPDIADILGIARRGWLFILAGVVFGVFGALAVLHNLSPSYKASSRIAFERTQSRYLQSNKVTNEPIIDDYDTLGQIYVISSESIVLPVVNRRMPEKPLPIQNFIFSTASDASTSTENTPVKRFG